MRQSKVQEFEGFGEIQAKELTVAELDQLLFPVKSDTPTLDRLLARHGISGSALNESLGLSLTDAVTETPSALRPLVVLFQEVNEDFFLSQQEERESMERFAGMEKAFPKSKETI